MSKTYSVKDNGDGLSLKERYKRFQAEKVAVVEDIERRDKKMAASARRLLSVPKQID